ncbi:autotransporter outer membrane beta-barrel domain-containing protein [Pseudomonas sp. Pseu.R1]|uniref:autotransporter outer membrane beta-barrel domain-containing protein n=1 Tax=Pseudomonas sp. Pseu.R1 TaxID=3379818 RepID=UPI003B953366
MQSQQYPLDDNRSDFFVEGGVHVVDGEKNTYVYRVTNRGTLKVVGGSEVSGVDLQDSDATINASTVYGLVRVLRGTSYISNSVIDSRDELGLRLVTDVTNLNTLSVANVSDTTISGASYGASVGPTGILRLTNSTILGMGMLPSLQDNGGLRMTGGTAIVSDRSRIIGEQKGIFIVMGEAGTMNVLKLDNSFVSGGVGPAIKVDQLSGGKWGNTKAKIFLTGGSVLESGNGRLLEVQNKSEVDFKINNSQLNGELFADDSSTLNVELHNHARLDGNIVNGNGVVIDSSGHWQLAGDNSVRSLAIDGGSVGFSEDGSHTLTLGQLSGRGLFDMQINLTDGTADLLNVAGDASGRYALRIRNTGQEAVPAEFEALQVVHTEGGNAVFELAGYNNRVDLGAYSYALEQQGTDWFIVGSGKTISPSTQSALALFNVGPTIWNSELTTLRSRMGEIRGREEGGGWMRSYGSRFNASLDAGVSYQQKQRGLSFGADAPVPVSDGHLLVGVMGGYSTSDLDMGRGSSGEVDSYYLGAYGTWLSDDGYYLDGVLKVNQFHNQSKVAMSDGAKAKGDYSNKAVGGSVEFGKHIKLSDDYFVEPFAQVSSVWVDGNSYTLDNGLKAKSDQTQSVLGKVGATLGRQFALKDGGVVQPYVRVAAAHEFSRGNGVSVNGQRFDSDVFGSRAELGAGLSVSLSERLQVHADFDYMKGGHVEQPWGANLGVRLAF